MVVWVAIPSLTVFLYFSFLQNLKAMNSHLLPYFSQKGSRRRLWFVCHKRQIVLSARTNFIDWFSSRQNKITQKSLKPDRLIYGLRVSFWFAIKGRLFDFDLVVGAPRCLIHQPRWNKNQNNISVLCIKCVRLAGNKCSASAAFDRQ